MTLSTATLPDDGLHAGTPMDEYRAWGAWGSSDLKAMRLGPPALVKWRRANPQPDTDATILGTAAHALILEPEEFDARYCVRPDDAPDRPTAAMLTAKKPSESSIARVAFWREFDAKHAGKVCLSDAQWGACLGATEAFQAKACVWEAFARAKHREASLLWTDPATGERLKARPDWWVEGECVYDLKVSRHAGSALAFRAYAEGWMSQLAHYRTGLNAVGRNVRGGRLVVIAPKAPHFVYAVEVKEAALDVLALEAEGTVKRLHECRVSGEWPGTPSDWPRVDLPPSALAEVVFMADVEEV